MAKPTKSRIEGAADALLGKGVIPPHAREFGAQLGGTVRAMVSARIDPDRPRDEFEASVQRLGISDAQLRANFCSLRQLHLTMYGLGLACALAAFYYALTGSALTAFGFAVGSLFAAVQGYVYGFRAWQIANRNLISLRDALRRADTYLML